MVQATDGNQLSFGISADGTAIQISGRWGAVVARIPLPGTTGGPPLMLAALPTSDPGVAGQIWANNLVLTVSAG